MYCSSHQQLLWEEAAIQETQFSCFHKQITFRHYCVFISLFISLFLSAQAEIEEWSSWDEEAPTSIKIEGGNGNVSPPPNDVDEEPDYFKDMAPTIRKTQKVCLQQAKADGAMSMKVYNPFKFVFY